MAPNYRLSTYALSLGPTDKKEYEEGLALLNIPDPLGDGIPKSMWKEGLSCCEIVPPVTVADIFIHLVETRSNFHPTETVGAYKGLSAESRKAVKDGWVQCFQALKLQTEVVVIKAKVVHSQSLSEPPVLPWAAINQHGTVIRSHCPCTIGLSKVCNHVGSILQVCLVAAQIREERTCTEELCTWANPNYKRPELFKRVGEMGKPLKEAPPNIRIPTAAERKILLDRSAEMPGRPAGVLLISPDHSENFVPEPMKVILPKPLGQLFRKEFVGLPLQELIDLSAEKVIPEVKISSSQASTIASLSVSQTGSKWWNRYRAYRVTASVFHAVLRTSLITPSISLIKRICYPEAARFSNEATRWGLTQEAHAMKKFNEHLLRDNLFPSGFTIHQTGVIISVEHPHLAASPDGILVSKEGIFVIEIKCPFKYRSSTLDVAVSDPTFPLIFDDNCNEYVLKRTHAYYYQIQLQMLVTGHHSGFFVVFTSLDMIYVRVEYDDELFFESLPRAYEFWKVVIIPELMPKYYTFPPLTIRESNDVFLPCYCQKVVPNIEVKECSHNDCKRKIFHVKCIPLKKIPKVWKCKDCTKDLRKNRKALKDVVNNK